MCYGGCDCERCTGKDGKMEQKKWVQHISGQGEKYKVHESFEKSWGTEWYYLPKSEYILCDPPEVWEKVEVGIRGSHSGILYLKDAPHLSNFANLGEGFRWVKSGDGVIVERRKS